MVPCDLRKRLCQNAAFIMALAGTAFCNYMHPERQEELFRRFTISIRSTGASTAVITSRCQHSHDCKKANEWLQRVLNNLLINYKNPALKAFCKCFPYQFPRFLDDI